MQIMRERHTVHVEVYALEFTWEHMPEAGFSFPCDHTGEVLLAEMYPEGLLNLAKCQNGEYAVIPQGVKDYSYTYVEPAQGQCSSCSGLVELADFTNTCSCGLEYNASGQPLAPRSQWEDPWDEE